MTVGRQNQCNIWSLTLKMRNLECKEPDNECVCRQNRCNIHSLTLKETNIESDISPLTLQERDLECNITSLEGRNHLSIKLIRPKSIVSVHGCATVHKGKISLYQSHSIPARSALYKDVLRNPSKTVSLARP